MSIYAILIRKENVATMQISDFQTIRGLFSEQNQYKIPRYQRRYVWDMTNWETLWQDIKAQLTENPNDTHFAGTIMMYQEKGMVTEIIDGQQRLTTFQLILCVIRDLWESDKAHIDLDEEKKREIEDNLSELTKMGILGTRNSNGYRIIPSSILDVNAFNSVVGKQLWNKEIKDSTNLLQAFESLFNNGVNENGQQTDQNLIVTAYGYFGREIVRHLEKITLSKLSEMFIVFTNRLQVIKVSIDSDDQHEPERIFQTINDTGRMLTDFDYLRNFLFLRTRKKLKVENIDILYTRYWDRFEAWDNEKLEQFFQAYLKSKLGPRCFENENIDIRPFDCYRKHIKALEGAESNFFIPIIELGCYADSYEELNITDATDEYPQKVGNRMLFYEVLQLPRLDWLLLCMKHAHETSDSEYFIENTENGISSQKLKAYIASREQNTGGLSNKQLNTFCDMLESYIVRSWLCENKYKPSYEYIINFIDEQDKCDLKEFVDHLTNNWPDPHKVKENLKEKTNLVNSNLLLYILYRIAPELPSTNPTPVDFSSQKLEKLVATADIYYHIITEVDEGILTWNRNEISANAEKISNSIGNITINGSKLKKEPTNRQEIEVRTGELLESFNKRWKPKVTDFDF